MHHTKEQIQSIIDNLKDDLLWESTSKKPGMFIRGESPTDHIERQIEFWKIKLAQLKQ
jgi:hypothetical protein